MYYCESTGAGGRLIDDVAILVPQFAGIPYVLVVEDDPAILSVILLLLETENYAAIGFARSAEVMSFLEQVHLDGESRGMRLPSVILLDLMMPVLSGPELAQQLSTYPWATRIPIVVMTAQHFTSDDDYHVPGMVDLLHKPFHVGDLLRKLEPYLAYTLPAEIG